MAAGRQRDEWERTASLIGWIAATFAGKVLDVEALNPVPPLEPARRADPAAAAAAAAEAKAEAWAELRAGFEQWVGQTYGGRID